MTHGEPDPSQPRPRGDDDDQAEETPSDIDGPLAGEASGSAQRPDSATRSGPAPGGSEPERDWDGEWQALAAGLGSPQTEPEARRRFVMGDRPAFGAGSGPRDYIPEPEDDSWEPPPVPPATGDRRARLAWAGILGGPLMMLLALIAFRTAPTWYIWVSIALFVAGCVYGFRLLPQRRRDPDDDGAEV